MHSEGFMQAVNQIENDHNEEMIYSNESHPYMATSFTKNPDISYNVE
ncbi:10709_t:CDS:2 [Dentiscutata erythropus]|uniref:10709_t:CDS:1 n=1 Tax=Dentiscutata erythropus TaxID=1348616 RepID=A0A9N8YZQ1_9GLOM|nr:10709_t:CDS:2 [Dentiscutata erythropus]